MFFSNSELCVLNVQEWVWCGGENRGKRKRRERKGREMKVMGQLAKHVMFVLDETDLHIITPFTN